ncbi:putative signal transduction response regulator, receiver domain protein [Candidatus Nitrososphaera gargensis Ga9.2]|uniref:Putative signal transduction response regulator, receiver domain protein n=1 Tax=Nitrososphaera gargensis (strain Ga9.2) TaxID=1237085 RepID=K0INN6_NITGG|nr:putative signal transduction response regulator, receiver domain protein [Candidatus Nitrososphaera gargensis Ga9.2]
MQVTKSNNRRSQALLLEFNPVALKLSVPNILSKIALSLPSATGSAPKDDRRSKPRILYIDDEVNITKVIKYGLEQYGFAVDVFNHPKAALSSFQPGVYDLLLIDIRLPEINGLDLCNKLLRIDSNVKICFITAYDLKKEEVRNRVPDLQTECIIKKPVSFDNLVSKINGQLHRNN